MFALETLVFFKNEKLAVNGSSDFDLSLSGMIFRRAAFRNKRKSLGKIDILNFRPVISHLVISHNSYK